jgi:multidrug transporter EmrE-like cation transporter
MLIAWFANGVAQFGLKVLTEAGLSDRYRYQYIVAWYITGLCLSLCFAAHRLVWPALTSGIERWAKDSLCFAAHRLVWPSRNEIAIGGLLAVCSVIGQACLALALASGAPGYVVFPLTSGANIFLVAAAGFLLFHEKVGRAGTAGIVLGMLSIIILSLP